MTVTFYTRRACPLCDAARRALDETGVTYDVVDVDLDADTRALYGERVPVIAVDGRVVAEGDVGSIALDRLLRRMS